MKKAYRKAGFRADLADLEGMAVQVGYEVLRMAQLPRFGLPEELLPVDDRWMIAIANQSALEAVLLHVRLVDEFLSRKSTDGFEDDVFAADYFDDGWKCSEDLLSQDERDEINRRLQHLSTERLSEDDFTWAERRIEYPHRLVVAFEAFIADLGEKHPSRVSWFGDRDKHVRWVIENYFTEGT